MQLDAIHATELADVCVAILGGSDALGVYALDWDFAPVPLAQLLDASAVQSPMADIDPERATPSSKVAPGLPRVEPEHTTHFSVVDTESMAVAKSRRS